MTAPGPNGSGHSADVQMELRLNGHVLPIRQLGPNFVVLDKGMDHPPADAEIAMWIDGSESCWPVSLVAGIRSECNRTAIARPRDS
jgi:hypothetical protein